MSGLWYAPSRHAAGTQHHPLFQDALSPVSLPYPALCLSLLSRIIAVVNIEDSSQSMTTVSTFRMRSLISFLDAFASLSATITIPAALHFANTLQSAQYSVRECATIMLCVSPSFSFYR